MCLPRCVVTIFTFNCVCFLGIGLLHSIQLIQRLNFPHHNAEENLNHVLSVVLSREQNTTKSNTINSVFVQAAGRRVDSLQWMLV